MISVLLSAFVTEQINIAFIFGGFIMGMVIPVLFVRRGTRPGLFAPRDNVAQFKWSMAGPPPSLPTP